jgi:hypothetical protein
MGAGGFRLAPGASFATISSRKDADMTLRIFLGAFAIMVVPQAASAQDIAPAPDPAQAHLADVMNHSIRQSQRDGSLDRSVRASGSNARAVCANRSRAAANMGADHPKVQRLNALCTRAGY